MQEIRQDQNRNYGYYIEDQQKDIDRINPIFTERPHYGIPKPKREVSKDE
jgi:hypothetical protein